MKTIITTTALSLAISATAAFANTNSAIAGSSGTLPSECSFVASSDGTMNRVGDKWVTTQRGTFTVKVRGAVADLSVTSDGILRDAGGASTGVLLDVDYTQGNGGLSSGITNGFGTQVISEGDINNVSFIRATNIANNGLRNTISFYVGGSALMYKGNGQNPLHNLTNDTTYKYNNTITCTQ